MTRGVSSPTPIIAFNLGGAIFYTDEMHLLGKIRSMSVVMPQELRQFARDLMPIAVVGSAVSITSYYTATIAQSTSILVSEIVLRTSIIRGLLFV